MQDITPDLVTPEQLVNEILRREQLNQMQTGSNSGGGVSHNKSGGCFIAPTSINSRDQNNLHPLMRQNEEDTPHHHRTEECVEMESRRSSMTKAMSIDEEAEEDEDNCNTIKDTIEPGCCCRVDDGDHHDGGGGGGCKTTSSSSLYNTGNGNNVKDSLASSSSESSSSSASPSSLSSEVVILDCQNPSDFQECHIRGALNVTFPAIMIRRIAAGKIDIFEKSKELKNKIANSKLTFVVYDSFNPVVQHNNHQQQQQSSNQIDQSSSVGLVNLSPVLGHQQQQQHSNDLSDLVNLIARKLAQNGCRVATLKGIHAFPTFVSLSGNLHD